MRTWAAMLLAEVWAPAMEKALPFSNSLLTRVFSKICNSLHVKVMGLILIQLVNFSSGLLH